MVRTSAKSLNNGVGVEVGAAPLLFQGSESFGATRDKFLASLGGKQAAALIMAAALGNK
jgi:hypothetical protein